MNIDFDHLLNRRQNRSLKWCRYEEGVLPMWLADTDFKCPEEITTALSEKLAHGIFGYEEEPQELKDIVVKRLQQRYGWDVSPDSLVFLSGVVNCLKLVYQFILNPGAGVIVHTPAYPPFLTPPPAGALDIQDLALSIQPDGSYEIDFDSFESGIRDNSSLYVLCNPHNPTGHVYKKTELERIADVCLRHNLLLFSDDIHCDLIFSDNQYIPIASLSVEIAHNTITLISPGKTFNIAGFAFSIAVIPDAATREKIVAVKKNLDLRVSQLAFSAAIAAYRDCDSWLDQLLPYLEQNREILTNFIDHKLPGIRIHKPGGTFLAWLDCQGLELQDNPHNFFLKNGRIACNDGSQFGNGGKGFIRLNFGCPKSLLLEAMHRMESAVLTLH